MNNLEYNKATNSDAKHIASLHKKGIPTGFLNKQSISFLEALYACLIKHEIVYVAKGKVVGFIAIGLYRRFLKANIFYKKILIMQEIDLIGILIIKKFILLLKNC